MWRGYYRGRRSSPLPCGNCLCPPDAPRETAIFAALLLALASLDGSLLGPDLAAADLMLAQPSDSPTPALPHFDRQRIGVGLRILSVERQLLSPEQAPNYFRPFDDFGSDLRAVRAAAEDARDCPPLHDALRLPLLPWAERLRFNRSFAAVVADQACLETGRRDYFARVLGELKWMDAVYDAAGDAADPTRTPRSRRCALKRLKGLLGDEDYAAMAIPPNVPGWCFSELEPAN